VVVLPGDKLPLVKSVGIVEQQLNLRQDNFLRIVVDTQTLLIDLIQYGNEIIFFVGRKVQRLIYRVGEKTVTVDVACQRMTQQKVGMEYKQVTRSAFHVIQIEVLHLVRCRKAQHTLIVVIMLLTIAYFTLDLPFEGHAIKTVHKTFPYFIFQENAFGQVNHADQWMAGLRQRE